MHVCVSERASSSKTLSSSRRSRRLWLTASLPTPTLTHVPLFHLRNILDLIGRKSTWNLPYCILLWKFGVFTWFPLRSEILFSVCDWFSKIILIINCQCNLFLLVDFWPILKGKFLTYLKFYVWLWWLDIPHAWNPK